MIPEVYGEKGWALLSSSSQYYEDAKECFKKALEEDPDNIEWNLGYATALSRLEIISGTPENCEPTQSMKQFRRVLELDPDHTEAMVQLALKLQDCNQNEEAFTLVEQALHKSPDLPYVLRYAAKFLRREGAVEKSIELLKKALEITPNSAFLHHQIEYHKAEEIYRNLLKLEDLRQEDKQSIRLQTGLFELHHGKSESNAISHFLEGYKINYVSKSRGLCRENLDKIIQRRLRKYPSDSKIHGLLGFLHQLDGERCEAISSFKMALEFDPDNEEYLSAIFELRLSLQADNDLPN
ncbi:hypothetical protein scyTo_0022349 [Scyliorhinus torazame]|uniref:Tetratricopeptide repeat protein n=1 Tax=Scyliorhinus torazame TaxID=75743 RepID=A0A401QB07_SCYTO|nr:hypothetical protein [Scyliorhinus torazame]